MLILVGYMWLFWYYFFFIEHSHVFLYANVKTVTCYYLYFLNYWIFISFISSCITHINIRLYSVYRTVSNKMRVTQIEATININRTLANSPLHAKLNSTISKCDKDFLKENTFIKKIQQQSGIFLETFLYIYEPISSGFFFFS